MSPSQINGELGFNLSKTFENHLKYLITQFSTGNSVNNFESTENKLRMVGLPVPIPERVQNQSEKQKLDMANIGQLVGGPESKSGGFSDSEFPFQIIFRRMW